MVINEQYRGAVDAFMARLATGQTHGSVLLSVLPEGEARACLKALMSESLIQPVVPPMRALIRGAKMNDLLQLYYVQTEAE